MQPNGQIPQIRSTNPMAILSLVFSFIFTPLGLIFGIIALLQIKRTHESGKGMAIAGTIISGLFTALFMLFMAWLIFFSHVNNFSF